MPNPKQTDAEFIEIWRGCGSSPAAVSKATGISIREVYARRSRIEKRGVVLASAPAQHNPSDRTGTSWQVAAYAWSARTDIQIRDGVAIVFSDAHYWPGIVTTAHKALIALCKRLKPKAIIANGDVFDGANISRHDPLGWQKLPTVVEELDAAKLRLAEIERAAPQAKRYFTVGNHDSRFDRRLASETAEFAGVEGFRLQDHLKGWPMSYSVMINDALDHPVMVRHAMRGGIHAVYNNTLHAGVSIVTGHLHAQLCRPFTDYRGTRYGVDCGTLADINGPQFSYTMGGPVNWRSGFVVLTFDRDGRLLPPEFCEVQKSRKFERAVFRGEVVDV